MLALIKLLSCSPPLVEVSCLASWHRRHNEAKKFKSTMTWPKGLDREDCIFLAIGRLVAAVSSCETFFLAVLECLVPHKDNERHCEVLWLSHRGARARIQMVLRVAKMNNLPPDLLAEVEHCAKLMNGISKLRNFYCHARYLSEEDGSAKFEGYELESDFDSIEAVDMVRTKIKPINRKSMVELIATVNRAERMSVKMVEVGHRLRAHTGALHVQLPALPD
jgi:hypothetical protein